MDKQSHIQDMIIGLFATEIKSIVSKLNTLMLAEGFTLAAPEVAAQLGLIELSSALKKRLKRPSAADISASFDLNFYGKIPAVIGIKACDAAIDDSLQSLDSARDRSVAAAQAIPNEWLKSLLAEDSELQHLSTPTREAEKSRSKNIRQKILQMLLPATHEQKDTVADDNQVLIMSCLQSVWADKIEILPEEHEPESLIQVVTTTLTKNEQIQESYKERKKEAEKNNLIKEVRTLMYALSDQQTLYALFETFETHEIEVIPAKIETFLSTSSTGLMATDIFRLKLLSSLLELNKLTWADLFPARNQASSASARTSSQREIFLKKNEQAILDIISDPATDQISELMESLQGIGDKEGLREKLESLITDPRIFIQAAEKLITMKQTIEKTELAYQIKRIRVIIDLKSLFKPKS